MIDAPVKSRLQCVGGAQLSDEDPDYTAHEYHVNLKHRKNEDDYNMLSEESE